MYVYRTAVDQFSKPVADILDTGKVGSNDTRLSTVISVTSYKRNAHTHYVLPYY